MSSLALYMREGRMSCIGVLNGGEVRCVCDGATGMSRSMRSQLARVWWIRRGQAADNPSGGARVVRCEV
jgi:hypothetical protein